MWRISVLQHERLDVNRCLVSHAVARRGMQRHSWTAMHQGLDDASC
jgi:hypothetical protein